jgi:hypothetical protein
VALGERRRRLVNTFEQERYDTIVRTIRVGNGCGFWGDNLDAPVRLVESGQLDYLTLEYLAELTLSIMAHQRRRDPAKGYASDFIDTLRRVAPRMHEQIKLKIITNAGGMNPGSCAASARQVLDQAGLTDARIAVVSGDDLSDRLPELVRAGHPFNHLDTGEPLEPMLERVVSANAYLGAGPIVEALAQGARVVITGRVADASLTVAPAVYEFGWGATDVSRVAGATVAGHLIECGAQVTGGMYYDWQRIPDYVNIGYPIAEIADDGSFTITKPKGTGGLVSRETVIEQLLYEIGDPADYITPDVRADLTTLDLVEMPEGVHVTSATGQPATDSYKVSIAYRDGFMASGMLAIHGRVNGTSDAQLKASSAGLLILKRLANVCGEPARSLCEVIGGADPETPFDVASERFKRSGLTFAEKSVILRVAVHDPDRELVARFCRELTPLVTSGPAGIAGYAEARPHPREVLAYWPALVTRSVVQPKVEWM